MPGSKRGIDRPTSRVVALIVLLMVAAAALRGYLPAHDYAARVQPGPGRAALAFVVVALGATLTVLVIAIIARLRDPRAMPPPGPGDLSGMLGGRAGRPSWRVLLVGLAVIVAWLLSVVRASSKRRSTGAASGGATRLMRLAASRSR